MLIFTERELHQALYSRLTTRSLHSVCEHLVRFRGIKMNRKETSNNYITFLIQGPRDGPGLKSTEETHRVYPDWPGYESQCPQPGIHSHHLTTKIQRETDRVEGREMQGLTSPAEREREKERGDVSPI